MQGQSFNSTVKSRIAPTPSGFLHWGNAMNFLLTEHLTIAASGNLRLRIDDLDMLRARPEYVEDIFETLHWLGIAWQEGPYDIAQQNNIYSQSLRLSRYIEMLDRLACSGQVFACTCSRQEIAALSKDGQYPGICRNRNLPLDTPNAAWRLHTPDKEIICWEDGLCGTQVLMLQAQQRDFIVRRKDGLPAYHIASLADDVDYGATLIVRGADLLSSTAAQLYLARLLGCPAFSQAKFYHHPLLLNDADGQKLAKSSGSNSLKAARINGKKAEDIRRAFTGWAEKIPM